MVLHWQTHLFRVAWICLADILLNSSIKAANGQINNLDSPILSHPAVLYSIPLWLNLTEVSDLPCQVFRSLIYQ